MQLKSGKFASRFLSGVLGMLGAGSSAFGVTPCQGPGDNGNTRHVTCYIACGGTTITAMQGGIEEECHVSPAGAVWIPTESGIWTADHVCESQSAQANMFNCFESN